MNWTYVLSVLQIILIDIVLSGDNAVVIALAAHRLPEYQRRRAILWGGAVAIALRIAFTLVMSFLLMVPGLRLIGGVVLTWIACKLLLGEDEPEATPDKAAENMFAAVKMIFLADFVMSLDNMLAVAGASHGDPMRLLLGLFVSIGIIMTCSALIARLMNQYKWLVYVGAGILAFTSAEMMIGDREVASYFVRSQHVNLNNHWAHEWKETHANVSQLDTSALPAEWREFVHHEHGQLTFVGQMTTAQRDELLRRVETRDDRAAIEEVFDTSHAREVPGLIPPGFRDRVRLWFQNKWPADSWNGIRHYPWVAWVFYTIVVIGCLTSPRWWKRKPHTDVNSPSDKDATAKPA